MGKVLSENEYFLAELYTWENDYRSLLQGQSDLDEHGPSLKWSIKISIIKTPKIYRANVKRTCLKTLGTSTISSSIFPPAIGLRKPKG